MCLLWFKLPNWNTTQCLTITPYHLSYHYAASGPYCKTAKPKGMEANWKTVFCATATFTIISFTATGQMNVPKFQFGLSGGIFVYQGDLTPEALGSYRTVRPAISLFAAKLLSPSFALRGNLAFGGLRGDDAAYDQPEYRKQRAFNFRSPVLEASGIGEWNVLGRNYQTRGFSPYVFAGAGVSVLNVHRDYSQFNEEYFGTNSPIIPGINADIQHSPPKLLLVLPVGVGVRYYFSDRIGISAETSYRIMSNDYLDGFSQAVDPVKGDHYYSHMVGVVYRLGKKNTLNCPPALASP